MDTVVSADVQQSHQMLKDILSTLCSFFVPKIHVEQPVHVLKIFCCCIVWVA
jgi:hypothetical protein